METRDHFKNGAIPKSFMSRKKAKKLKMKRTILFIVLAAMTFALFGQSNPPVKKPIAPAKTTASKFGALAIDRSNGFYYGWSSDYATNEEAGKRAIEECIQKGGNCTVVLSFSGSGCAAYRTVGGNVGNAFGWGLADTKEEADAIAISECAKRSNGRAAPNFVWSCNSTNAGKVEEIYNASEEIAMVITIGNQLWMNRNLDVTTFRNGDIILQAKNDEEWIKALEASQPAWRYLEDKSQNGIKYGKLYNFFAVNDSRGLAPIGYRIPTYDDWEQLSEYIGDLTTLAGKLKSKSGWTELNGTDDYGFNALPGGSAMISGGFQGIEEAANFWSSTRKNSEYIYGVTLYGHRQDFGIQGFDELTSMYVRCLKEE